MTFRRLDTYSTRSYLKCAPANFTTPMHPGAAGMIEFKSLTTAKSYLGFPCTACRQPIQVFTIPRASITPRVTASREIEVSCPHCGHAGRYRTEAFSRFEEPQMHA